MIRSRQRLKQPKTATFGHLQVSKHQSSLKQRGQTWTQTTTPAFIHFYPTLLLLLPSLMLGWLRMKDPRMKEIQLQPKTPRLSALLEVTKSTHFVQKRETRRITLANRRWRMTREPGYFNICHLLR